MGRGCRVLGSLDVEVVLRNPGLGRAVLCFLKALPEGSESDKFPRVRGNGRCPGLRR